MLRQPVDLQVGMQKAQLVGDRGVALRVAQSDGRGDVERALAPRPAAHPAPRGRRRREEVAEQQVHLHRVAHVRRMARSLQLHVLPVRVLGERLAAGRGDDGVRPALDDEQRAGHAPGELARLLGIEPARLVRQHERLGRRLESPADGVLDGLRRVRLGEDLPHEELDEAGVVAQPVVLVVLRPALVGVELVLEGVHQPVRVRRASTRIRRADEDGRVHALGMLGRQEEPALAAEREADDGRARRFGRVEHRQRVGGELALVVGLGRLRPVGAPVPRPSKVSTRQWRAR